MATDSQNYGRKVVDSRGGHFRIVSGDPRVGRDGPETFKLYASNDNGEVFLIAHGHGSGLGRIACDKSIEIHAGDKNDPNNVDIRISATTGDITINADRGRLRVNAKDIMMTADRDIDIKAGRNLNLQSSVGRTLIKANTAAVKAKRGNLVSNTWGHKVLANTFVPDDVIAKVFDPKSQETALGAGPAGDAGVAGAAAGGMGLSLQDLGIDNPDIGGIEPIETAIESAKLGLESPLADVKNLVAKASGAGGLLDQAKGALAGAGGFAGLNKMVNDATGLIKDPLSAATGGIAGGLVDKATGLIDSPLGSIAKGGLPGVMSGASGIDAVKGIGSKLATDSIDSLTSSAQSALGVVPGGNALTGVLNKIGSGSVGQGAAKTIGNFSNDAVSMMDSIVPKDFKLKQLGNLTSMKKDIIGILDSTDLAAIQAEGDLLKAQLDAAKAGIDVIVDEQTKTLLGGGTIEELKGIATKFKDGGVPNKLKSNLKDIASKFGGIG